MQINENVFQEQFNIKKVKIFECLLNNVIKNETESEHKKEII